ncbi:hypothetical protein TIFTF001_003128 [Ficus carica]|uniref:Gfo/Idh/MocA-like oxidoreductase C-terminal domain-containing protein n=1 Tax=Ficus carica TaxID=3494 RepID=A0AA88D9M5_FICCA|nr:hypothetical protein TIFTF001_003128 [Ficus carica]
MAAPYLLTYGIIGMGVMGREHFSNLYHLRDYDVTVVVVADPHTPSQKQALDLATSFNYPPIKEQNCNELPSGLRTQGAIRQRAVRCFGCVNSKDDPLPNPNGFHEPSQTPSCIGGEASLHYGGSLQKALSVEAHNEAENFPVVEAARKKQVLLVRVGLECRYTLSVAKLMQLFNGDNLGDVKMVSIREHRVPIYVEENGWSRLKFIKGTLVEKCCHFFDLMRLFAGANPVCVMALGAINVNKVEVPNINDYAYVMVEFENGCRGTLDFCMSAEGSKNEQEISIVGDRSKWQCSQLFFSLSCAAVSWERGIGIKTFKAEEDKIKYDGLNHGSRYLEHLNFLNELRAQGGPVPAVDSHDGLVLVAMGVAAQLSLEQRRFVTIQEVMEGKK